jgi:hypothetical protein
MIAANVAKLPERARSRLPRAAVRHVASFQLVETHQVPLLRGSTVRLGTGDDLLNSDARTGP